jgi:hypothetical protein
VFKRVVTLATFPLLFCNPYLGGFGAGLAEGFDQAIQIDPGPKGALAYFMLAAMVGRAKRDCAMVGRLLTNTGTASHADVRHLNRHIHAPCDAAMVGAQERAMRLGTPAG